MEVDFMYKVGDEVWIKGEVVEVAKDVTYPIGVRFRCATIPMLFTEEELELSTKTYEMEKKIKVGDVVKIKDEKGLGIVTAVCPTGIVYVLWDDGGCGDYEPFELEKTGRTVEGLGDLLRQIKE